MLFPCIPTSIKYKVEHDKRYLPSTLYIELRSLALQPLSAGNSAEFSKADNSKITQRSMNLTSLDSIFYCVYENICRPLSVFRSGKNNFYFRHDFAMTEHLFLAII